MAVANLSFLNKTLHQEVTHCENFYNKSSKRFFQKKVGFYQPNYHHQNNKKRHHCCDLILQPFNSPVCNFRQNVNLYKHHRKHKFHNKSRVRYIHRNKETMECDAANEKYQINNGKTFTTRNNMFKNKKLGLKDEIPKLPHNLKYSEEVNPIHPDVINFTNNKSEESKSFSAALSDDSESTKCWFVEENIEKNDCLIFKDSIRNRAHSWPSRTKKFLSYTSLNNQSTHFEKAKRSVISLSEQLNLSITAENVIFIPKKGDCKNDLQENPNLNDSNLDNLSNICLKNDLSKNLNEFSNCKKTNHPINFSSGNILSKNTSIAVLKELPNSTNLSDLENKFQTVLKLHSDSHSDNYANNESDFENINHNNSSFHSSDLNKPNHFSSTKADNEKSAVVVTTIDNCKSKEIQVSNLLKMCPNCRHINRSEFHQCSCCGVCLSFAKTVSSSSYRNRLSANSRIQSQEELKNSKSPEVESPISKKTKMHQKNISEREKQQGLSVACDRKTFSFYEPVINDLSNVFQAPNALSYNDIICVNSFRPHCQLNTDINSSSNLKREIINGKLLDKSNNIHPSRSMPIHTKSTNRSCRTSGGRNYFSSWQEHSQYFNTFHNFGAVPKHKLLNSSSYHSGLDDQFLGRRQSMTDHNIKSDYYLQSSNIHWPSSFHKVDNPINKILSATKSQRDGSSLSFSEVEELVDTSTFNKEQTIVETFHKNGCNQKGHILKKNVKKNSIINKNEKVVKIPYLPDEIILHVFTFLSHYDLVKCALACSRFCRIVDDSSLWRSIVIKKNNNLCDEWLIQIGKRQPSSLSVIQCHGEKISSTGLELLFSMCANSLKEMRFTSCSRGFLNGDTILLHAASFCHKLTYLDVSWCSVNDSGIHAISDAVERLETLCLNGCQSITDMAITHVVSKHGNSLRTLEIYGCFCITARSMLAISINCKNLTTLNLGQCHKLSDACIANLAVHLKNLENLDLRGCQQIRNNCIQKVARNCPKLRTLALANCSHISDMALVELSLHIPNLRSIDVCGCKNFTNTSVKALANNCQQLEYLDLSSTSINHKSVHLLASHCNKHLESLKLSFCRDITEDCIIELAFYCKRLKTLHLYGCKNIRDLKAALIGNPQLVIEM